MQALEHAAGGVGDALRAPGRARGVGDALQVLAVDRDRGRAIGRRGACSVEVDHAGAGRRAVAGDDAQMRQTAAARGHELRRQRRELRADDHRRGLRVVEDLHLLGRRMARVERDVGERGLLGAEHAVDALDRVLQQHRDPLARLQAEPDEGMGEAVAARLDLGVAAGAVAEDQRRPVAVLGGGPADQPPGDHPSTTMSWPSATASPSATSNCSTVPAAGALRVGDDGIAFAHLDLPDGAGDFGLERDLRHGWVLAQGAETEAESAF